ncbi:MAG: DciA family protein [Mariprofundales bacterium]
MRDFIPLGKTLEGLEGLKEIAKLSTLIRLRHFWPDIVGQILAMHTEPIAMRGEVLHVASDHPVMGQQVRLLQYDICAACTQYSQKQLTRIQLSIRPQAACARPIAKKIILQLSCAEKKEIARSLSDLQNKELRRLMYAACVAQRSVAGNVSK